jgi:hypothetical protein
MDYKRVIGKELRALTKCKFNGRDDAVTEFFTLT